MNLVVNYDRDEIVWWWCQWLREGRFPCAILLDKNLFLFPEMASSFGPRPMKARPPPAVGAENAIHVIDELEVST